MDQGRRLEDDVFALCKRFGLLSVIVGVEAGSAEMLKRMKKDVTLQDIWGCAEKLKRHGIGAIINFIVGFPGESPQETNASMSLARELGAMSPDFTLALFSFRPYPGNPISAQLIRDGYRMPQTLEDWADFDFVGKRGSDWLLPQQVEEVENFKFYQRHAYARTRNPLRRAMGRLCRWRVEHRDYRWPMDRHLAQRLFRPDDLS